MTTVEHAPITATESEQPVLRKIERILRQREYEPKLVASNGEEIPLPESLSAVLGQIVSQLMHGNAIRVASIHEELTTQEAADILNVSRPYLIKLLEEGTIPYVMTGTHRRIRLNDLMEYKRIREAGRKQAINELVQLSQELGLYD
ncbi:MAG TPA: helix-turn-helix domain-containing protein [Ktedonobacteraceae bacterium]|nr:helix-turn-helix domain-containing protein [Ktedonobacteraceae bacterium]